MGKGWDRRAAAVNLLRSGEQAQSTQSKPRQQPLEPFAVDVAMHSEPRLQGEDAALIPQVTPRQTMQGQQAQGVPAAL